VNLESKLMAEVNETPVRRSLTKGETTEAAESSISKKHSEGENETKVADVSKRQRANNNDERFKLIEETKLRGGQRVDTHREKETPVRRNHTASVNAEETRSGVRRNASRLKRIPKKYLQ